MYVSATESFQASPMHDDSLLPSAGFGDVPLHSGGGRSVSVSPPPSHLMDVNLSSPPSLVQRQHAPGDDPLLLDVDGSPPPGWAPPPPSQQQQQQQWPQSALEGFPAEQAAAPHYPTPQYPSIPPQGSSHREAHQQPAPYPPPQRECLAPPTVDAPTAPPPPPSYSFTAPPPAWPSAGASRQPQGGFEDGAGPTYIVLVGSPVQVIGPAPLPGVNMCGGGRGCMGGGRGGSCPRRLVVQIIGPCPS